MKKIRKNTEGTCFGTCYMLFDGQPACRKVKPESESKSGNGKLKPANRKVKLVNRKPTWKRKQGQRGGGFDPS